MQTHKIVAFLDKIDAKLVVLLCHHNADPDALYSAFAFSRLLQRLKPSIIIEIAAPKGVSRLSEFSMRSLPIKLVEEPRIEEANAIVMLDTNTLQQLNEWGERVKKSTNPLIVIDHHASHPETESVAKMCVTNESASSTCEIIYGFFKEMKVQPDEIEAKALFLGMAFDTRHFVLAKSSTFKAVADLVDAGVNTEETISLLSLPMDSSERVARLKACQRSELTKVNGWLVVCSSVRAYQASAARSLIALGADVAFVAGKRAKGLQISMRSTSDFYKKTGIHLGRDVAKPVGEYINGMGGGHAVSAGANGTGDVEAALQICLSLVKDKVV